MRIYYDHVTDALRELADESEQRRLWLSQGGEVSSLAECKCRLFDDSGLGDALGKHSLAYTPSIDEDLRRFDVALRGIDDGRPPESIIVDPAMDQIRTMAATLLQTIRASA